MQDKRSQIMIHSNKNIIIYGKKINQFKILYFFLIPLNVEINGPILVRDQLDLLF